MGQPAAKQGDQITATDTHIVVVPSAPPTPLPHPFVGVINGGLSGDVPTPPGTAFQNPPANKGTIKAGSATVKINGKAAARNGDPANTCNDPTDLPVGTVIAVGNVLIG
ncbi:MAG: hypothetical protein AUI36_10070 [Cyanobacteria bacterium 13_1_40CM_2_61_4]|nr:MAG: hypothetical protein AUI36_10070 [Cyanobacteria bacterium 13_1_40CM_2_61_4]